MKIICLFFMCLFVGLGCNGSSSTGDGSLGDDVQAEADNTDIQSDNRIEEIFDVQGDDDTEWDIPDHINYRDCGTFDQILPRAPDGDALCAGKDDCYQTSGAPNHGGCPNTCSCLCMYEVCYQFSCTLIPGCTEPPEYN